MYTIVGTDQKEYGPVAEEQVRAWIAEGRANGQTIIKFADGPWKPLATFPEFAAALGSATPSAAAAPPVATPPPLRMGGVPSTPAAPTSGTAIAGLVCSILGLFCCGPLFATLGLILSAVALSQIKQDPTRYTGKQMALAGIVLALVGYVIFAVLIFTGVFKHVLRDFPRHF